MTVTSKGNFLLSRMTSPRDRGKGNLNAVCVFTYIYWACIGRKGELWWRGDIVLWASLFFFNLYWSRVDVWASQMALVVKNPPANAGDIRNVGLIPGQEDPLGEDMATHSSISSWRIPWPKEPGGLQSLGSQRVWHDWSDLACMQGKLVTNPTG